MQMPGHVVVAHYSGSGNTRKIANLIQQEVGGTIHEIRPQDPYPSSYDAVVDQAKIEIQTGYRPALPSALDHIESYDTIFVGSPNWWNTIAPQVATLFRNTICRERLSCRSVQMAEVDWGDSAGILPSCVLSQPS